MSGWKRRATAVVIGLLSALALGEIAARIAIPRYEPRKPTYEIAPHGDSWVFEPGSRVVFEWDGDPFGVLPEGARQETAINAAGLRGELPLPGRPTVVVLGDSFTFGEGVADDATIPALLEAALAETTMPPPAVVNAGVSAHGTVEEAARLPDLLAQLRPRAVLLVHVPNDAVPWFKEKERRNANLLEPAAGGSLRLLDLVRSATAGEELEHWYGSFYDGANDEYYPFAHDALRAIAETCKRNGVSVGVACHPFLHRLDNYPLSSITDRIRAECDALQVAFIDLLPAFEGQAERQLWVHPTDRHPNARANALTAARLAPFVRDLLR